MKQLTLGKCVAKAFQKAGIVEPNVEGCAPVHSTIFEPQFRKRQVLRTKNVVWLQLGNCTPSFE